MQSQKLQGRLGRHGGTDGHQRSADEGLDRNPLHVLGCLPREQRSALVVALGLHPRFDAAHQHPVVQVCNLTSRRALSVLRRVRMCYIIMPLMLQHHELAHYRPLLERNGRHDPATHAPPRHRSLQPARQHSMLLCITLKLPESHARNGGCFSRRKRRKKSSAGNWCTVTCSARRERVCSSPCCSATELRSSSWRALRSVIAHSCHVQFVNVPVWTCLMNDLFTVFACLGFLSPANRGALMTCSIVLWVCLGAPAGYVSARIYKSLTFFSLRANVLRVYGNC